MPPMCLWCKRYKSAQTCTSFPEEIPEDIWDGAPHYLSRAGENPFEPDGRDAEAYVEVHWPRTPAR